MGVKLAAWYSINKKQSLAHKFKRSPQQAFAMLVFGNYTHIFAHCQHVPARYVYSRLKYGVLALAKSAAEGLQLNGAELIELLQNALDDVPWRVVKNARLELSIVNSNKHLDVIIPAADEIEFDTINNKFTACLKQHMPEQLAGKLEVNLKRAMQ